MAKTIALHGCYDIANFGDQLLASMLARRLRQVDGIEVVIPMLGRRGFIGWLSAFFHVDACIYGGGGYFSERSSFLQTIKHWYKYVIPAGILRARGVPYYIFCPGAGPLERKSARLLAKYVCNGARRIIVRDEGSKALLIEAGVKAESLEVIADFVLSINQYDLDVAARSRVQEILQPLANMELVGGHLESLVDKGEVFAHVTDALISHLEFHPKRALVLFSDHGNRACELYSQAVLRNITYKDRVLIVPRLDDGQTLALIACLDGVVTSKLHVGICAYSLGVSAFSVWTHPKTERFYRMIGRGDCQVEHQHWQKQLDVWLNRIGSSEELGRLRLEAAERAILSQKLDQALSELQFDITKS